MFSAADLTDALRKRGRRSLRPEQAPGEFPPGWAQWFADIGARIGRITGATADAIIAVFLQREPTLPARSAGELNRWQAFATLWRQQWQPPEAEERRVRLLAIAITLVVHVVLLVLLLWLAYVRFNAAPAPAGEEVVQVEFIGRGTPQDQGGGPPNTPTPAPIPSTSAPRVATSAPARRAVASTAPPRSQPPTPTPAAEAPQASASPLAEQPLQVSDKPVPEAVFALPPPTPRVVQLPQARIAEPKLHAPLQAIELVRAPPPVRKLEAKLPDVATSAAQLRTTPTQIEVIQPLPAVQARQVAEPPLPMPTATLRQAPTPVPLREQAESATPAASSNATAAAASPAAASSAEAPAAAASSPAPSERNGTRQASASSGRGPATSPKPGAWPTPKSGDDWGASSRERPGGNAGGRPGLLNGDGSPKLASGTAGAGGGYPPGSDNWTLDQIDHAGTWLKRPSNTYEPTRFDNVWVPNETLLEQWVRQNVREMSIPIPGTTKKLHCVVSLLQLGGGCGITDPDLQDQEATARPPPEVPFKPGLQEDQGSLRKPAGP